MRQPATHSDTDLVHEDDAALVDVFTHIAERWGLSVDQRCRLLDNIARSTHYEWTHGRPPRALSPYQREAVTHVIGIDLAILTYVGMPDDATGEGDAPHPADGYVHQPGSAPDGEGVALDVMLSGITGLAQVRYALEARAGASPIAALLACEDLPPDVATATSAS